MSSERSTGLLTATEAALFAMTAAAALGLGRVFSDTGYVGPVLVAAIGAHGLSAVLRRAGVTAASGLPLMGAGGALVALWTTVGGDTAAGIPTPHTLQVAGEELRNAWTTFGTEASPVASSPGLVMAAVAGTWVLAGLADWAAFRVDARFEAVVPSLTLFIFGATLGSEQHQITSTAAWMTALVVFLAAHGMRSVSARTPWVGPEAAEGHRALARRALAVGAIALVGATAIGPNLPGADAEPVVPWKPDHNDDPPRITISPLVDIRSRLVQQSDVEVFTVASDIRAYWRLTSLDTFDGRIWSSVASYGTASGDLKGPAGELPTQVSRQRFTIAGLSTIWVPAAFRPTRLVAGEDLRFDPESGSLVTEDTTFAGMSYEIESEVPRPDPAALAGVDGTGPPSGPYLDLPPEFPLSVSQLAGSVVAGAATPYDQAMALQQHFRSGAFTYSLEAGPGHSNQDLEQFLFQTRVGYCEQFSGAFAAMARAVGLPARVAVGFTPGEVGADGLFHVRGEHAHAWPEVWLPDAGWVAFEPTPGRGAPGAEAYTGVPEQQAVTGSPETATTLPPQTTPDTAAPAPEATTPDAAPTTLAPTLTPEVEEPGAPWWQDVLLALGAALGVALLLGGSGFTLNRVRLERRRRIARTAAERIDVAWQEVVDELVRSGVGPRAGDSPARAASRAASGAGSSAPQLRELAGIATAAAYGPVDPVSDDAARAGATASQITGTMRRARPPAERLRWAIDPRPPRHP